MLNVNINKHAMFISEHRRCIMQQRYCECGRPIHVMYCKRPEGWKAMYWEVTNFAGEKVQICPDCGRALDVDSLR